MTPQDSQIIYTLTDEAPLLATCSFCRSSATFAAPAGIDVAESDISVAGRILAEFPDCLTPSSSRCPTPWPSWAS